MSGDDSTAALPTPSFEVLVQVIATPCYIHLGLVENPATGKREKDMAQARWALDLLHVVEEKTRGNLGDEQKTMLEQVLHQLRTAVLAG